jgi:hypothetical protein
MRSSGDTARLRGCPEGRFGQGCWPKDAVVVFEQPGGDQPVSGRVLCGVAERVAGAVLARTGEGAVQHRGGGKVERVAGVSQTAGNLATVNKAWSWAERVAVVPDPGEDLAGVREGGFEVFEGVDRSGQRPFEPAGELGRGAWLSDAGEHRFDGAVIGGPVAVQRVGRAASGIARRVPVSPVPDNLAEPVRRRGTRPPGWVSEATAQAVISAAAASW